MANVQLTDDQRFDEWRKWLDVVHKELTSLRISRHVYNRVGQIVAANPDIQQSSAFYDCYSSEHAVSATIAIRRLAEVPPPRSNWNVNSLAALLKEISTFPQVLSRKRYVAELSKKYSSDFGNDGFDNLVGPGTAHIDPVVVIGELAKLQQMGNSCKVFADKRIAHIDAQRPSSIPTYVEIDECIDFMEELVLRYLVFIEYISQVELMPTWLYDWEVIFRKPWIP